MMTVNTGRRGRLLGSGGKYMEVDRKQREVDFFFQLDNSNVFQDRVGIHSRNASSPAV